MNKKCLGTCVILMTVLWSNGMIAEEVTEKADSFYQVGAFRKAALLYEKAFFQRKDSLNNGRLLWKKAQCYKQMEAFEVAYKTLNRINSANIPDSLKVKYREESILMPYLADNPSTAFAEYEEAKINLKAGELKKLGYLRVLVLVEQQEWKRAKKAMKTYAERKPLEMNIDSLFQGVTSGNAFKKPNTGKTLSYILPGAGQIYAGHFWKGMASFGLTSGTAFLGVNRFLKGYYFSSLISGTGLFLRFYLGGKRHSQELIEKYNQKKAENFKNLIIQKIIKLKEKNQKNDQNY